MRVPRVPGGNPQRVFGGALGIAALSLLGGASVSGSSTWQVGDLAVCVGNGQCRIYSSTQPVTTISVPQNPKRDTGEPAWSSAFNLYVVDSRNQKVNLFAKTSPHSVLATIDTAANYAAGLPGPLVVDSAGNLYVGMTNADVILKYDRNGIFRSQIKAPTENGGGVDWMALADDHRTLWYTSGGRELQRLDLENGAIGSVTLPGTGVAAGIRILTVTPSFNPNVTPVVNGTNGILVADGANIKLMAGGSQTKTYDVSDTDEGWRALTLHPDGTTFLAATGDGRIYRFLIDGSGAPVGSPIVTGVSGISGLSVKGGAQLNIRPVRFASQTAATNVQALAVFGNPLATATDAFPRHAFGLRIPSLPANSDFPVVVSSNWAVGNGECLAGSTAATDYDCRAGGFTPLPRCIPYVSGSQSDCVFYRLEDDTLTVPTGLGGSLIKFIDFHVPANGYTPDPCTGGPKGNPRMLFVEEHGAAFTNDITIGSTQTATDPIFGGGTGRTGSDYGGFDRCLGDGGGAIATILKPANGSSVQVNSSVPFEVWITRDGQDVTNALDDPNDMSLFLYNNDTGASFLEPQPTPGGSPDFFTLVTVKLSKNVTRTLYRANWDSTGKPLGSYTGCVTSTDKVSEGPGLFAPVCVNFTVKGK